MSLTNFNQTSNPRKRGLCPQDEIKALEAVRDLPKVTQVAAKSWDSHPGLCTPLPALGSGHGSVASWLCDLDTPSLSRWLKVMILHDLRKPDAT